jgi:hypothetical protein
MTQTYEDDWVGALLSMCDGKSINVNHKESFKDSIASAKTALHQQLNAYFLMRDFGVPGLRSIKARSVVFARELNNETVPSEAQQTADELATTIKERQAFQYAPSSAPLTSAKMKQFNSTNLTTSGTFDDIESYRWEEVHAQAMDKVFRGKVGLVKRLIKCGVLKPEATSLSKGR